MHDWLQYAIAALIVFAVFYSVHRHGRGNPESTGRLARKVTKLEETLYQQGSKIEAVEVSVDRLATETATKTDIARIEQKIDGDRNINERTWSAVSRLQDFFIERGIGGRA